MSTASNVATTNKRIAIATAVNAAILLAPICALGRWREATRPGAIACVLALVVLAAAETAARRGASDASRFGAPGTKSALVSGIGLLVTAWLAIGWPASAAGPGWAAPWLLPSGALACAGGVLLRVVAIRALGDSFTSETVLAPGRRIVRRGVYRWMRHPSDVGLLLFSGGLVGMSGSVAAIAPVALLVATSSIARMLDEDRLLAGAARAR